MQNSSSAKYGRAGRFRVLAIVDDFTHECLPLAPDTSLTAGGLARKLDARIQVRGIPKAIVSDNRAEMTRSAVLKWCQKTRIDRYSIAPGKPTQHAFIENFNSSFRNECLNKTLFSSLDEARP